VFNSNLGRILHHFGDTAAYRSKNCKNRPFELVMGDSAKKKTIRFNLIRYNRRVDSIQFDWIHCSVRISLDSPHQGFWTLVLKLLDQSHDRSHNRPARIATELLIAFAEASSDIAANVSHDAI